MVPPVNVEISSQGTADTLAIGRRLASLLRAADVVLLAGDLGCGKTVFVAGVAEGLGVEEAVTSPSFVLVRRYRGFVPLVHADVYRLRSLAEVADLELADQARDGVLMVEWGQAVAGAMPPDHLLVEFVVTGPSSRLLRFVPKGRWAQRPLQELTA